MTHVSGNENTCAYTESYSWLASPCVRACVCLCTGRTSKGCLLSGPTPLQPHPIYSICIRMIYVFLQQRYTLQYLLKIGTATPTNEDSVTGKCSDATVQNICHAAWGKQQQQKQSKSGKGWWGGGGGLAVRGGCQRALQKSIVFV